MEPTKLERDINICDDCYAESPYCQDCANYLVTIQQEEIEELRLWKAKASPFLEEAQKLWVQACNRNLHSSYTWVEAMSMTEEEFIAKKEKLKQDVATLTELLGGNDDTT